MLLPLSALVLVFWILVVADRKRWWPSGESLRSEHESSRSRPTPLDTVVAVPARNEEEVIGECLPSLLAQSGDFLRLIYVDDRSEDRTGSLARELVSVSGRDAQVEIVEGEGPPPGWSGKLYALQQAVSLACAAPWADEVRWFLFTDADIYHPPCSVRSLRAKADEGGFDLVSVMVRLRTASFWERLLIPPFVYFFQLLYPFRRVSDPASRIAAAAGGCVLISRRLLEELGGLESIRGAVIDDVTLARRAKDFGGRLWLGTSPATESRRPYDGLRDIAHMVSRTAFTQLRYSYSLLFLCLVSLAIFLVSPPILCIFALRTCDWATLLAAGGAWGIQTVTLYPVVRHQGVPWFYAATLPLASAFYLWMTALSAWNHRRGRGTRWKGRELDTT